MVLSSPTQLSQGVSKHLGPDGDVFRRSILIRTMADACAAANKQHGNVGDPRHEKRVVVGPTHHGQGWDSEGLTRLSQRVHRSAARLGRWIGMGNSFSPLASPSL